MKKKGLFSKARDIKDNKIKKDKKDKQKVAQSKTKNEKNKKSITAKKTVVQKNVDEELEAIKKQQKKAARKISRKLSNPASAAITWIKRILPSKGRDNALKFAQTAGRKKTKTTKKIFYIFRSRSACCCYNPGFYLCSVWQKW